MSTYVRAYLTPGQSIETIPRRRTLTSGVETSGKLLTCGWSDASDASDSCGVRIPSFPLFRHKFQAVRIFSVLYLYHTLPELRLCQKFVIVHLVGFFWEILMLGI
jgi:hypothetical protein